MRDFNFTETAGDSRAVAYAWWGEAGVHEWVAETPCNWLEHRVAKHVGPTPDSEPLTVDFPEILSDFMQWLASAPQVPGAGPPSERILPAGDATAALMVLVDMPEAEDIANKRLLSGPAGEMFDRMLAAMQLDRGKIWLAPLNLSRFVQGQNGENNDSARFALIKHHVALVRPQRLWLMGDAPARAILGMNVREASGRLHNFNHIGLNIRTIATLHAQVLHAVPKRKAEVWADMKRLFED